MKSKITSISILFTLIAFTTSYSMQLNFDLALLNHQLIALNQNIGQLPLVAQERISQEERKRAEAQPTQSSPSLLNNALENLQKTKRDAETPELYESAFITPFVAYPDKSQYIILGQELNGEYSAFGGQLDKVEDGNAYATAAREFAEEISKTKANLHSLILLTYDELKERLRSPETRAIVQNLPWTSRSTGKTRNLNTVNFIVNFTPAEITHLRKNFQKTKEIKGIASISWGELTKAIQTGRKSIQAKIILPGGNYQGGFTEIKLRPIFVNNMKCYLASKDTGYIRSCEPVIAQEQSAVPTTPTKPEEIKITAAETKTSAAQQPTPITQLESKEIAALQRFIDFNHPAYIPIKINNSMNYAAPKIVPVEIQPDVQLVQVLTAWQDLPIKAFVLADFTEAEQALGHLDYRHPQTILNLFENYNSKLFTIPQKNAIAEQFKNKTDIFLGGGPASCGYHALKNLLLITNLIFSGTLKPQELFTRVGKLLDLRLTNDLFGLPAQYMAITNQAGMGIWRLAIINELTAQKKAGKGAGLFVSEDNGEWLTDTGLEWLLAEIKNNQLQIGLPLQETTVILNALNQPSFMVSIYHNAELLSNFKKAYNSSKNFTGALFINPGAHWFTLVVNKVDKKTQFIIVDSKNRPNYSSVPGQPINPGARQIVEIISNLTRIAPDDIQRKLTPPTLSPAEQEEYKKLQEQLEPQEAKAERARQAQLAEEERKSAEAAAAYAAGLAAGLTEEDIRKQMHG
jgi:hypothetical protein